MATSDAFKFSFKTVASNLQRSILVSFAAFTSLSAVPAFAEQATTPEQGEPDGQNVSEAHAEPSESKKLSPEEQKTLDEMLANQGLAKDKVFERYDLGKFELQSVYNDKYNWTKDDFESSSTDGGLQFTPLPSLRFTEKKTGKIIAQLRIGRLNSECADSIELANIDATTPWPEVIFQCQSPGSGGGADVLVLSVTHKNKVLLNTEFANSMSSDEIVFEGSGEVMPQQKNEGFMLASYTAGSLFISRSSGLEMTDKTPKSKPAFLAISLLNVGGLFHCNACTQRPYSLLEIESGVWKDANKKRGAKKFFRRSLAAVKKQLRRFEDKKKFKTSEEEEYRQKSLNETLFLNLTESLRVGSGKAAWKMMNKKFISKVFKPCGGEENCPHSDWQSEIKNELTLRGYDVSVLK